MLRKLVQPPLQNIGNDWVKGMRYGDARRQACSALA